MAGESAGCCRSVQGKRTDTDVPHLVVPVVAVYSDSPRHTDSRREIGFIAIEENPGDLVELDFVAIRGDD